MGGKLSSLFRENYRVHFYEDEWGARLQEHLVQQKFDKHQLKSHLQICWNSPCETFWDEISLLKNFSCILLFTRSYSLTFQEILLTAKDQLFRKLQYEHPFILILKALIAHLLHLPSPLSDPKNRRMLFQGSGCIAPSFRLPIPRLECEIAAISALLGIVQKDQGLKEFSLNIAKKMASDWEGAPLPFLSLWSRSEDYCRSEILLSYYLMSFSVGSLLEEERSLQKSDLLFKRIAEEVKSSFFPAPVFAALIEEWVQEIKKPIFKEKKLELPNERSFHFHSEKNLSIYHAEKWHFALTLQGVNTGLGSLQTKGCEICAFGPQFFPLSSSSGFGIYRLEKKGNDIPYEEGQDSFSFKGWTRLTCQNPSKPWMGIEARVSPKRCNLAFSFLEELQEKLALSFYIKAKNCSMEGGKPILPKSLHRYSGKGQKVFCNGEESFSIEAYQESLIHIIPLAGKGFFWDADFLVAFEVGSTSMHLQIHLP